jgi:glutamate-1-semialdehyde 2,1-aminomutase
MSLELLTRDEIARINQLGDRLRQGLRTALTSTGVVGQVTGMGSLTAVHFTDAEVHDFRSAGRSKKDLLHCLHLSLLKRGILAAPRGDFCISTPMREREIDITTQVLRSALEEINSAVLTSARSSWCFESTDFTKWPRRCLRDAVDALRGERVRT